MASENKNSTESSFQGPTLNFSKSHYLCINSEFHLNFGYTKTSHSPVTPFGFTERSSPLTGCLHGEHHLNLKLLNWKIRWLSAVASSTKSLYQEIKVKREIFEQKTALACHYSRIRFISKWPIEAGEEIDNRTNSTVTTAGITRRKTYPCVTSLRAYVLP